MKAARLRRWAMIIIFKSGELMAKWHLFMIIHTIILIISLISPNHEALRKLNKEMNFSDNWSNGSAIEIS
jgi:hypothetical protein